jgi:hypothetical protein
MFHLGSCHTLPLLTPPSRAWSGGKQKTPTQGAGASAWLGITMSSNTAEPKTGQTTVCLPVGFPSVFDSNIALTPEAGTQQLAQGHWPDNQCRGKHLHRAGFLQIFRPIGPDPGAVALG